MHVLLLNNDTEMIEPESIKEMLDVCMRPDVGIVGAKLLYEDNTIQHAGVIIGFGGIAGHACSISFSSIFMVSGRISTNTAFAPLSKKHLLLIQRYKPA